MAWALQFDGVNDSLVITRWEASGDFNISVNVDYTGNSTDLILGSLVSTWFGVQNGVWRLKLNGADLFTSITATNGLHSITISRTGTSITIDIDGVKEFFTSSDTMTVDRIGTHGTGTSFVFEGRLIGDLSLTGDTNRVYRCNLSSHAPGAQPVLTETVTASNATGVNFPTDGSAWVDLGFEGPAALQFDGVNDYLTLGSGVYMHQRLDAGDWAYSIDAIIPSTTNELLLLGRASVAAGYLAIKNNQVKFRYNTSSSSDVTIATTHVFDGSRITLDIYREAGGVHKVAVMA